MRGNYIRTDLADECRARAGLDKGDYNGISFSEKTRNGVTVSELEITNSCGAAAIGKPVGKYITVGFGKPWLLSNDEYKEIKSSILASLKKLIGEDMPESVLVVGLGNRHMTSDCLGPETVDEITVTRHIKKSDSELFRKLGKIEVSAIVPGVSGETGMESAEIVKKAVDITLPSLCIVIDSLAARSPDRLMRTVQLCNTGISPGSGTGNNRKSLDSAYLGVPVIALGVPCVVDSSTLVFDALEKGGVTDIPEQLSSVLENGRDFFVSLKECDIACRELSLLLSEAIDDLFVA